MNPTEITSAPVEPLKNQIITWLEQYPYWFQYAGKHLLETSEVSELVIENTYKLFLEDEGLKEITEERPTLVFPKEEHYQDSSIDFKLFQVKEVQNVNALASSQVLQFHPNLTIVFGANGVGKSGYIRLLNKAFDSRGDKNILGNVFESTTSETPTCKLVFESADKTVELSFPEDQNRSEFSQIAVFDTECARAHIQQENKLLFTPRGFEFFDLIISLVEKLRGLLQQDISSNKKSNDFITFFKNDNEIRDLIDGLNEKSSIEKINALKNFSPDDRKKLDDLNQKKVELLKLNIPSKLSENQNKANLLEAFIKNIKELQNKFSPENIGKLNDLIGKHLELQKKSSQEGISRFEELNIEQIGSKEWKEFIIAAKKYANYIDDSKDSDYSYPSTEDSCLFCLQKLHTSEHHLITSYWNFLKSEYEAALEVNNKELKEVKEKIHKILIPVINETTTLYSFLKGISTELANKWNNSSLELAELKETLIKSIDDKELCTINFSFPPTTELDEILVNLETERQELTTKNPASEICVLDKDIQFLNDKLLLSNIAEKILDYVHQLKWASKANKSISSLRTNSITAKQGQLFTQHITNRYTETFQAECKALRAPNFVKINQRNSKGQTLRKLQIEGTTAHAVLSEGEQRSICLADFMTEIQLNPFNKGVVFDDPVTSLDHERKELIATRLVHEAAQRQVIIFTHDISFLVLLQIKAENQNIGCSVTTLRKFGQRVGIVDPNLPWVAQKVKDRIGFLKSELVKLQKLEKESKIDDYTYGVKSWYGLLREGWERSVEERLFKGVIERFNFGIQTQKLKKVIITEDLLAEIESGMTEASKWVHDTASELNSPIPESSKLYDDLLSFENFSKKCVPA